MSAASDSMAPVNGQQPSVRNRTFRILGFSPSASVILRSALTISIPFLRTTGRGAAK